MTYSELQIQLDLNSDNRANVLKNVDICQLTRYGYLFVDDEIGQCYLFDKNGQEDDISKVKTIGNRTFYNCTSLKSISIPNSVKSIKYCAFFHCASLTSISIPDSVESIGGDAFSYCTSLTSISIPDSVESVGSWAFYGCTSLKDIVFKGKLINQVKTMSRYPWGIKDKSVIKVEK